MNRLISVLLCCVFPASVFAEDVNSEPVAHTNKEDPEWLKLKGAAAAYVEAFNGKNGELLAELFANDAVIHLTPQIKVVGRDAIKKYFQNIFTVNPKSKIGLEATAVSFQSSKNVVEKGMVVVDNEGELSTHYYVAQITKQDDGKWRIQNSKGVIAGAGASNEELAEVAGIVGDWMARLGDAKYKVTYMWEPSGTWILGKGLFLSPNTEPIHTTSRIGIDAKTGNIVSWSFDSMGGYSHSSWKKVGDGWQLEANGVNAEGQSSKSKQIISLVGSNSVDWIFTERELGGKSAEDFGMRLVKSPPKPFASMEGAGE